MPSRNVLKVNLPDTYYHVYARGRGKQNIYHDDEDYRTFLNLFKRHLSNNKVLDSQGLPYMHLHGKVELLCYCLMPNHFHLLLYQVDPASMSRLMRAVIAAYTRYYNKKYSTSGSLLESTYKASRITSDAYLLHISRYIHLNPKNWRQHPYSSIHAYFGVGNPSWLQPKRVVELFESLPVYADFLDDTKGYKDSLEDIKSELANK